MKNIYHSDIYKFNINTLLINNDLTINFVLTENNILLNFNKISITLLTKFIKDINIKHIYFYDDIVNKKFTLNLINKNNYKLFTDKCDSLNIKYHIGNYNINEK